MNLRIGQLSDRFYVSGQIAADHVAVLAEHGFKTIVNNRPDGEQWGQPTSDEIAAAAAEHGIDYVFLPVRSNGVVPADVEAFIAAREKMQEGPVLLFCRTGARCTMLWQLAEQPG
jgi:sulfide:quinone oxidoreductase